MSDKRHEQLFSFLDETISYFLTRLEGEDIRRFANAVRKILGKI